MNLREEARKGINIWCKDTLENAMWITLTYESTTGKKPYQITCPDCGSHKYTWNNIEGYYSFFQVDGPVKVRLECRSCGNHTPWDYDSEASKKIWNNGVTPPTMKEELEEINVINQATTALGRTSDAKL